MVDSHHHNACHDWMGWQSATAFKVAKVIQDVADRTLRLETLHPGDQPHPPLWTQAAIDANTAQIVVLKHGQEVMRIDMRGQTADLKYLIKGMDDIKKNLAVE